MKKVFVRTLLFTFVLVTLFCVSACAQTTKKTEELVAPENLQVEKRVLTWDAVEHATGYAVYVNNIEYKTEECRFALYSSTVVGGLYTIDVMACGDGENQSDSPCTRITVELEAPASQGADEIFRFTWLEDLCGYEVDLINKKSPKLEGTVVIPDFFGDFPVKKLANSMFVFPTTDDPSTYPEPLTGKNCNKITTAVQLPAYLECIGIEALSNITQLEQIVIPDSVRTIYGGAFAGCTHMTRVVLPKGLKIIPARCFQNTAVSDILLPDMLEVIGDSAFENTYLGGSYVDGAYVYKYHIRTNMTGITFPASVKQIGARAFAGREDLKSLTFMDINSLQSLSNDTFTQTGFYEDHPDGAIWFGDVLYAYKGNIPDNFAFVIPENSIITGNVFEGQKGLVSVTIPGSVRFLGRDIFKNCTSLSEVVLGEGHQTLPDGIFQGTESLKTIQLPGTLTEIGDSAFFKSGLEEIVIPENVKTIGGGAFNSCVNLKKVTLSEGLESICNLSFARCEALESVVIPSSVKLLDMNAFSWCIALKEVVFPAGIETVSGYPFQGSDALTHLYFTGSCAQWQEMIALMSKADRKAFNSAPVYFYAETQPTESGNYWHYVDGVPTPWKTEE